MLPKEEALQIVEAIRRGQFEDGPTEVKSAHRGLPKRIYEVLSALANRPSGGILVLGLDEEHQFAPVGTPNPQRMQSELADVACAMEPALRIEATTVDVDGKPVMVVEVPECDPTLKPCYYKQAGLTMGSYVRVGNTNRRMTDYEVFSYVSGHSQPTHDREAVPQAALSDLDEDRLSAYLNKVRQSHPQRWEKLRLADMTFEDQLCQLGILVRQSGAKPCPTLAGLLCFGRWPQKLLPSLVMNLVHYAGTTPAEEGPRGERFLDNAKCGGDAIAIVEQALQRTFMNVRKSTLIEGMFHREVPEYPEEAIREAIINALAHRDYSPMARSAPIRLEMYADRLEVQSPGGLYGAVTIDTLEQAQSTRNGLLMGLLEDLGLVENRGSGIRAMIAATREARLEPPRYEDTRNFFRVTFRNTSLMSPESVRWLNRFGGYPLNDNQRTALVFLRPNDRMTNADYRRLNNVYDTTQATRELRELVSTGLVEMHDSRRWAYYTLAEQAKGLSETPPVRSDEQRVLEYVRHHGDIGRSECAGLLGTTLDQASYILGRLRDRGTLRMMGRKRWARYTLP
jgi:ATP-dependent DNA helicase RecG